MTMARDCCSPNNKYQNLMCWLKHRCKITGKLFLETVPLVGLQPMIVASNHPSIHPSISLLRTKNEHEISVYIALSSSHCSYEPAHLIA